MPTMTDDQFNEAKKLIDGDMSISKAAKQVGVNYSTLYRRLHRDETPQVSEAKSEPEPAPVPEAEPHIEAHPSLAAIDWNSVRHWTYRPETQAEKTQREHDERLVELKRKRRNESHPGV